MKHTCEAPSWKPVPSVDDPQTFHYVCSACGEANPLMIGTTHNNFGPGGVYAGSALATSARAHLVAATVSDPHSFEPTGQMTELSPYEWLCLEAAEGRATMPRKLVDLFLVEARIEDKDGPEVGIAWVPTDAGYRLLLNRRREGGAENIKPAVFGASWGHSSGPKSDDW